MTGFFYPLAFIDSDEFWRFCLCIDEWPERREKTFLSRIFILYKKVRQGYFRMKRLLPMPNGRSSGRKWSGKIGK